MAKVTKKFNNFEYAPGISSYGINGNNNISRYFCFFIEAASSLPEPFYVWGYQE